MKLKSTYNVVIQLKVKPGKPRKRFLISINQLGKYVGEKRADFIIKNLLKSMDDKKVYKVQNKATVSIYLK